MTAKQRKVKTVEKATPERERLPAELSQVNLNVAGIDVGASSHFVAVSADRAEPPVREFAAFTADLYRLADRTPARNGLRNDLWANHGECT